MKQKKMYPCAFHLLYSSFSDPYLFSGSCPSSSPFSFCCSCSSSGLFLVLVLVLLLVFFFFWSLSFFLSFSVLWSSSFIWFLALFVPWPYSCFFKKKLSCLSRKINYRYFVTRTLDVQTKSGSKQDTKGRQFYIEGN